MAADYDGDLLARYIHQIKNRPGMSIAELSRRSGVSTSTLWEYAGGSPKKAITIPTVLAIARAVGDDPIVAFRAAAGLTTTEPEDTEIAMVLAATGLSDQSRDDIIAGILVRRERNRQSDMEDTLQMIRVAGGRVA